MEKGGVLASFSSTDLVRPDLDRAGADLGVDRLWRARLDVPKDRNHVLRTEPSGGREQRVVVADDDLRHPVAIANVDEQQRAEISNTVHPAEQHDVLADVGSREGTAGVRSRERS